MAVIKRNSLSGLVGPVVVYTMNGQQIIRARPRHHKKSKASRDAAKQFGLASRISSGLRHLLHMMLHGINQKKTRYRFDAAIREWLNDKQAINDSNNTFLLLRRFLFNEKIALTESLRAQPTVEWVQPGKIVVRVPALVPARDMVAPADATSVQWFFTFVWVHANGAGGSASVHELAIPYNNQKRAAQTFEKSASFQTDQLAVATLRLRYVTGDGNILMDEKWLPAGVIGTCYFE